jgi:hypothetical protein
LAVAVVQVTVYHKPQMADQVVADLTTTHQETELLDKGFVVATEQLLEHIILVVVVAEQVAFDKTPLTNLQLVLLKAELVVLV